MFKRKAVQVFLLILFGFLATTTWIVLANEPQQQLNRITGFAVNERQIHLPTVKTTVEGLELRPQFGNRTEHDVFTDGIFAIWWHKDYDLAADAPILAAQLNEVRRDSLHELGLKDPINALAGVYVNVYIHDEDSDADQYPSEWGNGVGSDEFDFPYMTLPIGAHNDPINVAHEGFHIFQYNVTNLGYAYEGDSAWFIEASANWYAVWKFHDTMDDAFMEAGIIHSLPFVALWRSWDNAAFGDPVNWQRETHQYALHTFLFYLTEVHGVSPLVLTQGFFAENDELPQEYLYQQIPNLREVFADWTARNAAEFAYMTRAQWERAQREVVDYADPNDIHPYVATFTSSGANDAWFSPPEAQMPRGWSYNVIGVNNRDDTAYTFEFDGMASGSEGADAYFAARVVVKGASGYQYHIVPLVDGLHGELTVNVTAADEALFLVITAVPEQFTSSQTYPYEVRIGQG
ncbi:MAG: hypothetical protein AAF614_06815 [Chloroflexota bacterium]